MMRVLFVGSGLCSACGLGVDLPKHLIEAGVHVDTIVPHTDGIDEGVAKLALRAVQCETKFDGQTIVIDVLEGRNEAHDRIFYLDAPQLRSALTLSTETGICASMIYAQAVCDWIGKAPIAYDVIHCDGLLASLVATLMRSRYGACKRIANAKVLVSLPGIEDKGAVDLSYIAKLGLPSSLSTSEGLEFYGKMSILKGAYLYADALCFPTDSVKNTITKNVGKDIGMEGVLFDKLDKIYSVSFGIDRSLYAPETGKHIEAMFDANHMDGKAKCKAALTRKLKLDKSKPLVAFVGRLAASSGIDLVNDILDDLMDQDVSLLVMGVGAEAYNNAVASWTQEFKGRVAWIGHVPTTDELRQVMSAADILLLPNKQESSSRLHLMAMRYGAVVVARAQGMVAADIVPVTDIDHVESHQNGFTFEKNDADEFYNAAMDALDLIHTKEWEMLRTNAMNTHSDIKGTAKDCVKIYDAILNASR